MFRMEVSSFMMFKILCLFQGLNRLAAIALLFLNEEDAFWCLVAIIERLMPGGYYKPSLIDAHVDQVCTNDLSLIKWA